MPETKKTAESPQTPDDRSNDTTGLGADVRATRDEALRDARSTVTRAGRVMDIVEQGELTESRRSALEVLKEKLTMLQTRIDKTEGVASEIEKTLARIDTKVKEEDRLREEIALTEARTYITNPAQWSEFIGYAGGVLRRQEYLSKDAVSHPDDATLASLNARRDAAVGAYTANTPATPTTHNWQPNTENERRVLGAMKALAELEDVTQQYEKYRGMVDGIRTVGDRTLVVPSDTNVTLDVRRGGSQQPSLITLSSVVNSTYTSGTQELTIQRTPEGWNVTMKPEFMGTVLVNRTPNAANWNQFTFGTPERNPAPERTAPPATAERTAPRTSPTQQRQTPRTENPNSPARTPEQAESSTLRSRGFGGPEPSQAPPVRTPTQRPATQPTQPRTAAPSQPSQERAPTQRSAAPSTQPRGTTPSQPQQERTPEQREAAPLRLPANQNVYIRMKGVTNRYNFLQPNFRGDLQLDSYAMARRSPDRSEWIITPLPGFTGTIQTSLDRVTWQDGAARTPVRQPAATQRTPEAQPPAATPQPNTRTRENTESMRNSEVVQTSATTLEFPANNPVNISYKTSRAYNAKPYELRTNVSKLDFYLYSITKENGVWKFSMKPGQSGEITIGLADGKTQRFQLGEGALFTPPSVTKKAPATEPTTPNAPEKKTPQKTPSQDSKIATTRSASATPAPVAPKEAAKPKTDSGLRSRSFGGGSPEATRPVAPVNKETVLSAERVDTLFNAYSALYKEYAETVQKDFATYGGNKEWRLFDQEISQVLLDIQEPFQGSTPRFVDLKGWRGLIDQKDRVIVATALTKLQTLLKEYKGTRFEKQPPTRVQKINTLTGDSESLKKEIARYRSLIIAKGGDIAKEFATLDTQYTEALKLTKKPEAQKAILVCHATLAKNYAEAKGDRPSNFFGPAFNLASDVASFRPGMTPEDFRTKLLERAERTPVELKLTPKQILNLVSIKQKIDVLRTKKGLTDEQRYDELVGIIGDDSGVLEDISKESRAKLKPLEALGYNAEVVMKDVLNPDVIDWLIATHVSATPVMGMSDRSFFYVQPVKKSPKPPTPNVAKTPEMRAKGIPRSASKIPHLDAEKDDTEQFGGRLLTAQEVQALGLVLLKGEKAKVIDGDTYIACTKTNCRPIKSKAQMEEAARKKVEAAKTTKNVLPSQPAEATTKTPEKNNGISANGREFRIGINESFTMNFNPPMGGSSSLSLNPSSFDLKGIVVNAKKYSDLWVIDVLPQYEGTITLTRARDKASASLTVKADPAALAAIEKAKDLTVREVTTEEEFNELVLKSPVPVIVDLYATWCVPCQQMHPDLEALAREQGGTVRVVKVDGEKFSRIQSEYAPKENGQYKFPTLLVFEKGKHLRGAIGKRTRDKIRELLPPLEGGKVTMR